MRVEQFFTQPTEIRYADPIRYLQHNLAALVRGGHTDTAYVHLSEGVCTSSRYEHHDLYEAIAADHDVHNIELPRACGFVHTRYRSTLIWYLSYFTAGTWSRVSARRAVTVPHNCVLDVYTWTEIQYQCPCTP